jgi:hypothetical protein
MLPFLRGPIFARIAAYKGDTTMDLRTFFALLGVLALLVGCPTGDDDDATDDDSAADDDTGDDDVADDDDDPSCGDLQPPGYGGSNGFHFVDTEGADVTVENPPYEHEISSISSGMAVSTDNGDPPENPVMGEDYIWTTFSGSPFSVVTAGEQVLQSNHEDGARLTLNVIPDFPDGMNDQRTYSVHPQFSSSGGIATCTQAPQMDGAFQCTYEAKLVWVVQDEGNGENVVAGCIAVSGAFDTQLVPAS